MAIPGYTGSDLSEYNSSEFDDYVTSLVGILGDSRESVNEALVALREYIIRDGKMTNVINTDGSIDLSKMPLATGAMWRSSEVKVYGNPETLPVYFGWEDGVRTLIFGEEAVPYIQMASLPREQYLTPPNLVLIDSSGLVATGIDGTGGALEVLSFVASFLTPYGETGLSNAVEIGPLLEWGSVTLGVVEDDIPTYALRVKYYRKFNNVYRLVTEVKL